MIFDGLKADMAYLRVEAAQPPAFIGFRDAALGSSSWKLHLHDVLRGLEKGMSYKWYHVDSFDAEEYEYFERVENGDLNWIIPTKILSFCGPHEHSVVENGYPYHAPNLYFDYFRENKVTTIVRLNMPMYDAKRFTNAGFQHVDLFFVDGSTPSDEIVEKFIKVVDSSKGAVAIHCKAGLGRTGTLIACWMMKEYGMTAPESIAWLRICRPGSVIGPQQEFLLEKQRMCWELGGHSGLLTGSHFNRAKGIRVHKLTHQVDDITLTLKRCGDRAVPPAFSPNKEISRVTVTAAKPLKGRNLFTIKKITASGRPEPYPTGTRVEMPASPANTYQLRPRPLYSSKMYEVAKCLAPNASALGAVSSRCKASVKGGACAPENSAALTTAASETKKGLFSRK